MAGQIALLGDHKLSLADILSEAEGKVTALSEELASAKAVETDQAARVATLEGLVDELEQGREAADKASVSKLGELEAQLTQAEVGARSVQAVWWRPQLSAISRHYMYTTQRQQRHVTHRHTV